MSSDKKSTSETPDTDTTDTESNTSMETSTDEMSQAAVQVTAQDGNDERGTPLPFVRKLQDAIGGMFDLDPCSGAEPQPIAHTRFTKEDNGLAQEWTGYDNIYVNPPYSDLKKWLQKIHREATRDSPGAPGLIMCLLPGNTSTQWFQQHATQADYLCLIEGRLTFHGTNQSAPFASILVVYGDVDDSVLETLDNVGTTYTKTEIQEASRQCRLDELVETDGGVAATSSEMGPPAPGLSPADSNGMTIRDVSTEAPAVPQGLIDLWDVRVGDEMHIEFDTSTMGFPQNTPESLDGLVLAGEPSTTDRTQTPGEWDTVFMVDDEKETYAVLLQNPDNKHQIKCNVSVDGDGWQIVEINTLNRVSVGHTLAIEPYGEGTSYVC